MLMALLEEQKNTGLAPVGMALDACHCKVHATPPSCCWPSIIQECAACSPPRHPLLPSALLQGAFMAALCAQGLPLSGMQEAVRLFASEMGSVRRLLSDLTFPLLSGGRAGRRHSA